MRRLGAHTAMCTHRTIVEHPNHTQSVGTLVRASASVAQANDYQLVMFNNVHNIRPQFNCDGILNTPITLVPFETGPLIDCPLLADAPRYVPTFRM